MAFEKPVVVIDNGSFSIKAGFSCDNHPVSIFRTIVGRPNYLHGSYGKQHYDVFIGDEAVAKIEDLEFSRPIVNGKIVHWDNMERIWHHVFYRELKVAPEDRSVILGCACTTSMEEKIKCCEVFFETLNTPALCVQTQSVLSLYGSGCSTGISVDLGYDTADINAVYEGGLLAYAHIETNLAGAQVSDYIGQRLAERKLDFGIHTPSIIEGIKRDCVYITEDAAMSMKHYKKPYQLPTGEEVYMCQEAFMTGELFFQPDLVLDEKSSFLPLHEAVVTCAMKCDSELRPELFDAIVPCGGMAPIPGLFKRLALGIEQIIDKPVNILSSPESYAVSWLGGATFAGMPDSKKLWVHKKQFEEHGARVVKNKFL